MTPQLPANPIFFATQAELRRWLRKNHKSLDEAWIGFYKKGTGKPSITWPQLVDELLCFGWIDGVRKSLDAASYVQRVTPRRKGSIWSAVNIKRARELIELKKMTPAGLIAFEARDESKTDSYSAWRELVELPKPYQAEIRANKRAWTFFESQPPHYRKIACWFVMSAKKEETQRRRLERLIRDCADGRRLGPG